MSVHANMSEVPVIEKTNDSTKSQPSRNTSPSDECIKAHVAETSRLEDEDDACFDSIG